MKKLLDSPRLRPFSRTRGRLTLALMGMAALPVLLIGTFSYFIAQQSLQERVYAQLNGILDLKQDEVHNWLALVVADTRLLADNYVYQENLTGLIEADEQGEMLNTWRANLVNSMRSLEETRAGYSEVFFVLPDGELLLSTNPGRTGDPAGEMAIIQQALASPGETAIQDIYLQGGQAEMAFARAVHSAELSVLPITPRVLGVVVIRVRLAESLYPIIANWPARQQTGEIFLLRQVDEQWQYASPLRFTTEQPWNVPVPSGLQAGVERQKETGQVFQIWSENDYRGEPVFTGARPIPETNWMVALEQDRREATAPIIQLRNIWAIVTVAVLLAAFFVAGWLARTLTGPLQQLTQAAHDVAEGKLSTSVALNRRDEFGELANTFNTMIASVSTSMERSDRHAKELQALVNLSDAFLSSVDMRLTLESALREGLSATRTDCAAGFLMLETGKEFQTVVQIGMPEILLNVIYPMDAHSAPGYAMMQRRTVASSNLSEEKRFSVPPAIRNLGIAANITAPMLIDGRVVGAITLASFTPREFNDGEVGMVQAIANHTAIALERTKLVNDLSEMYDHTLSSLVSALDTRDRETEGHSKRVVTYTLALADRMKVPADLRQDIARGAMLHDIGKIGVPDAILHKTGQLSEAEWAIVRKHPEWGKQILEGIRFLEGPAQMVLTHHERWDGTGYPEGLTGEQIPLGARIFAVVDAFDAMTSFRPYRSPESYQSVRAEIRAARGTQFDPDVVDAFLEFSKEDWMLLREHEGARPFEMGSLRRIGSGQLQSMNIIVSAITSSLDIQEVIQRTARTIADVTRAASVGIYLFDADDRRLAYSAGVEMPDALMGKDPDVSYENFIDFDSVREGHIEVVEDLATATGTRFSMIHELAPQWKSALVIPLREGERVAGLMALFSKDGIVFEEEEQHMFEQVAKQLGQALANARLHEKVRYQAITDGLTGAYNRRYLDDFLSIEVKRSQRYRRPLAIILLDIDHFRDCNERGGHQSGDKALRDTVQLLNIGVRSVDLVARYGGEEFLVVLPETEEQGALEVAERMRRLIEKHQFPCGRLTASFGVASSDFSAEDSPDVQELVGRADKALYEAKHTGRNRVQVWHPELTNAWNK